MLMHADQSLTAGASAVHLIFRPCLHPDHVIYPEDSDRCLSSKLHEKEGSVTITAQSDS